MFVAVVEPQHSAGLDGRVQPVDHAAGFDAVAEFRRKDAGAAAALAQIRWQYGLDFQQCGTGAAAETFAAEGAYEPRADDQCLEFVGDDAVQRERVGLVVAL